MLKYTSTISIEFPKWQPKWILRTDRFYGCSVVAVCDDNKVVAAHANRIESNENIIYYYTVLKFGGIWCLLFGFVARKRVFQIQIQINFYLSPHIARTRHYYNVGKSRKDKGIQRKWFCYGFLRKTRIYLIDLEQLFGDLCGNRERRVCVRCVRISQKTRFTRIKSTLRYRKWCASSNLVSVCSASHFNHSSLRMTVVHSIAESHNDKNARERTHWIYQTKIKQTSN